MRVFLINVFRFFTFFGIDFFYRIVTRSRAIGAENIPKTGGVLLAPNHLSAWDVFLVPYFAISRFSSRQVWLPAKIELFEFPPMALLLTLLRVFPVKRGKKDTAAIQKMIARLKEHIVIIYPEGTRSKTGKLGRGKVGIGKIILEARPAVVPTLVINTNYCFPPGAWLPNLFQKLYVVYGKPLQLDEYYAMENSRQAARAITDRLMEAIAELKEEYRHLEDAPAWAKKKVEASQRKYAAMEDADSGS